MAGKIGPYVLAGIFLLLYMGKSYPAETALQKVQFPEEKGLWVSRFTLDNRNVFPQQRIALFTVDINDSAVSSGDAFLQKNDNKYLLNLTPAVRAEVIIEKDFAPGWKADIIFRNISEDTVKVANVIPFGRSEQRIYLTASGPWSLARTKIFRPNLGPVGVVLPDNAWEMGYGAVPVDSITSICALTRRTKSDSGITRRWWTLLPPKAEVQYALYADGYRGEWQNGFRLMFRDRYLYDLENFDNTLYQREDLSWVRHDYVITTQMAWDHDFYDTQQGGYNYEQYLQMGRRYFGGWDIYILWPTWPTLGLDQRNQWDLYRDLPGGLQKIHSLAEYSRDRGTRFFISYNPWDQSTRQEDPYKGMARLIDATDADGVILDTYGSSNEKLQQAADSVKQGVVMYSEGMAVPKDMPTIITGRVHDAIYMPPPLNLNKLIKPQNAIFRVCQLADGEMHRETSVAFFNGYGVEINVYRPGRPDWMEAEYLYLGKLALVLRQNSSAFLSPDWTPLIPTLADSIWVNRWPDTDKTIYTVFSLKPEGFDGPLFKADFEADSHFVSLIHHEEIEPDTVDGRQYARVKTGAFNRSWLNTRKEGNVDCIAEFPAILQASLEMDSLSFTASRGDSIIVWKGNPSYQTDSQTYPAENRTIKLLDVFGRYEGKIVVQLLDADRLLDERVLTLELHTPRLISTVTSTKKYNRAPEGMVEIPGSANYFYKNKGATGIIPYPDFPAGDTVKVESFYLDQYPVTNAQFEKFLNDSHYLPADTANFLQHWEKGTFPQGQDDFPVVYVSLEDARAYAEWAGKRLPTSREWQYAAQGGDTLQWPWGSEFDSSRCNVGLDHLTAVDEFPSGASSFGVMDLVGNVWQLTNDMYDNSSYYYIIIRGGSYYHPTSSWWYVKGGPQPLDTLQMLLRVSPGFERNATVGFRCAADAG
ncbi:MAG: SUMF1/EgtB/PvdO family nonheme iron enzyme [Calditrichia bacterium]